MARLGAEGRDGYPIGSVGEVLGGSRLVSAVKVGVEGSGWRSNPHLQAAVRKAIDTPGLHGRPRIYRDGDSAIFLSLWESEAALRAYVGGPEHQLAATHASSHRITVLRWESDEMPDREEVKRRFAEHEKLTDKS